MVILIISHIHILREALAAALNGAGESEAFGASSHEIVQAVALEFPPSSVVIDASHPEAMTLVAAVRAYLPQVNVIVLATHERDEEFFAWAEFGISGYLGPDTSAREVLSAVRRAEAGEVVCSPRLTALMLSRFSGGPNGRAIRGNIHELTLREREVAQLLAQGMSNKLIARELHLALSTAKNHVHNVLEKWNVCSRGEAAACYRQMTEKYNKPSVPKIAGLRTSQVPQPGSVQPQLSGPGRMLVQHGNGR